MASHPDINDRSLSAACDLLTDVAGDLQEQLSAAMATAITPDRAGRVIKLACQVEEVNCLAAAVFELRITRLTDAKVRAKLAGLTDG